MGHGESNFGIGQSEQDFVQQIKESEEVEMATAPTAVQQHKSFWKSIGGFFKKIGYYVSEGFQALFGKDAAQHFAVAALALLKSDLGKIAFAAVEEAEKLAAGIDKRAAAFAVIEAAAKAQGIDAAKSLINMLIEISVQALRGAFGQSS
jgi:hypothetical protein